MNLKRWLEDMPLERSLFFMMFGTVITGLLVFAATSFFLVNRIVARAFTEKLQANQTLFTDSVHNEILTGLDSEVYRKCKLFFQSSSVVSLQVIDAQGRDICRLTREPPPTLSRGAIALKTLVYFDEFRALPAATIRVAYKNNTGKNILWQSLLVLVGTIAGLALLLGFLGRFLSRSVAVPVQALAQLAAQPE